MTALEMVSQTSIQQEIKEPEDIDAFLTDVTRTFSTYDQIDSKIMSRFLLVARELGTNLVKHAEESPMLLCHPMGSPQQLYAIDLYSTDKSPGMANPFHKVRDSFSSSNDLGIGLGAAFRNSDEFDLYSRPGEGTIVFSRIYQQSGNAGPIPAVGMLFPFPGETFCGDRWALRIRDNGDVSFLMVDGLGHGTKAERPARQALDVFLENKTESSPRKTMMSIHEELNRGRGAVGMVGFLNHQEQSIRYAGVGNITGLVYSEKTHHRLVSMNGTCGHAIPTLNEFDVDLSEEDRLLLHSDGIQSRYSLQDYDNLHQHHAAIAVGLLSRDFTRSSDDRAILVLQLSHNGLSARDSDE